MDNKTEDKKINIEGSITAYFNDVSLYEKYVESDQECNERIKKFVSELIAEKAKKGDK